MEVSPKNLKIVEQNEISREHELKKSTGENETLKLAPFHFTQKFNRDRRTYHTENEVQLSWRKFKNARIF